MNTQDDIMVRLQKHHLEQKLKRKAMIKKLLVDAKPYSPGNRNQKADPRVSAINKRWKIARDYETEVSRIIEPFVSKSC